MSGTPGDFFIGIIDFFAVVLPGGVLLWTYYWFHHPDHCPTLSAPGSMPELFVAVALTFVIGSFNFALADLLLSPIYRVLATIWKRIHKSETDIDQPLVGDLQRLDGSERDPIWNLLWKRLWSAEPDERLYRSAAFVRANNAAAASYIDRQEAHEKLFRGLTLVFLILVADRAVSHDPKSSWMLLMFALLSLWRFVETRLAYLTSIRVYFAITKQPTTDPPASH